MSDSCEIGTILTSFCTQLWLSEPFCDIFVPDLQQTKDGCTLLQGAIEFAFRAGPRYASASNQQSV
jgi:hypothetical protein